jgi:uncharacterized protein (DUF2461 family)
VWRPEAIEFLRELEDNNDREWFKANRERYDRELVAPAKELAGHLSHQRQRSPSRQAWRPPSRRSSARRAAARRRILAWTCCGSRA